MLKVPLLCFIKRRAFGNFSGLLYVSGLRHIVKFHCGRIVHMQRDVVKFHPDRTVHMYLLCIHRCATSSPWKEINMQPTCNRSWSRTKSYFLFFLRPLNFGLLQWDFRELGWCQNVLSRLCDETLLGQEQSDVRQHRKLPEALPIVLSRDQLWSLWC